MSPPLDLLIKLQEESEYVYFLTNLFNDTKQKLLLANGYIISVYVCLITFFVFMPLSDEQESSFHC